MCAKRGKDFLRIRPLFVYLVYLLFFENKLLFFFFFFFFSKKNFCFFLYFFFFFFFFFFLVKKKCLTLIEISAFYLGHSNFQLFSKKMFGSITLDIASA